MILLLLVGVVVLAVGKVRLTRNFELTGNRARWYGLTILVVAFPFSWLVGMIVVEKVPASILEHPIWRGVFNYGLIISFLIVVAIPFRNRGFAANGQPATNG